MKIIEIIEDGVWLHVITDHAPRPKFVLLAKKYDSLSEIEEEIESSIARENIRKNKLKLKKDKIKESALNAGYGYRKNNSE